MSLTSHDKMDIGFILLAGTIVLMTIPYLLWPDPTKVPVPPSFLWDLSKFVTVITGTVPFGIMFWCLLSAQYFLLTKDWEE